MDVSGMSKVCNAPFCHSRKGVDNVIFHSFPRNEKLRKKWMTALKLKKIGRFSSVCSKHFQEEDYLHTGFNHTKRKFLKKISVPSQLLPVDNAEGPSDINYSSDNSNMSADQLQLPEDDVLSIGEVSHLSLDSHFSDIYILPRRKEFKDSQIQTIKVDSVDNNMQTEPIPTRTVELQVNSSTGGLIDVGVQGAEMLFSKDKFSFSILDLLQTDEHMVLLTGLDNSALDTLTKSIAQFTVNQNNKQLSLTLKEQVALTLIKIHFDWAFVVLCPMFQITEREVKCYFSSIVEALKLLISSNNATKDESNVQFNKLASCEFFLERLSVIAPNLKMPKIS